MKYLFIDSQIWLSLYDFSNDDLKQFSKLNDLLNKDVLIYLTRQVVDEVYRNRENKIKNSLNKFKSLDIQIPNLCKGYSEYEELSISYKDFKSKHSKLLKIVEKDIETESLHADNVIKDIFSKINIKETTCEILKMAVQRYEVGNPPGKNKSYGDAINWEILLDTIPKGENLFFVSADKDFRSVINEHRFNPFLLNEWKEKKRTKIHFYKSLTEFFNNHLKDIKLSTENKKNELIRKLGVSNSFQETHKIVLELSQFSNWNNEQVSDLIKFAFKNSQISCIIEDPDISYFFRSILIDRTNKFYEDDEVSWVIKKIGGIDRNFINKDDD